MTYSTRTNWDSGQSRSEIRSELERWNPNWGAAVVDLDTIDFPKAGTAVTKAAVYFSLRGVNIKIECDSQTSYRQNIRCVAFAVKAMRMNEVRGIADTMAKAYLQLEAPKEQRDPHEVLQVRPEASPEMIEAAYKELSKRGERRHPDVGGNADKFKELQEAYERIKEDLGVAASA